MKNHQLHEDLNRLRAEINQLAADKVESREKLNKLIGELEARMENPDEDDERLIDNLKDAIKHFEAEHPRATTILNDIMVTLSNMGI